MVRVRPAVPLTVVARDTRHEIVIEARRAFAEHGIVKLAQVEVFANMYPGRPTLNA